MQFVSFCTVLSSQFVVSLFRRTGMKMVQRYFAPVECVKSSTSPLTRCHVCSSVSVMSVHNRGEHDLPCQYHRLHWSSWFPSSIPPPDKGAGSLLLLQFHSCNQGGTAPPYYLEWGTLKMIVSLDPIPTQNLISNVQKDIKYKKNIWLRLQSCYTLRKQPFKYELNASYMLCFMLETEIYHYNNS